MTVQASPEIQFTEWTPDLGEYNTGLTEARNCVANDLTYGPINSTVAATSALAARCLGAYAMRASDGTTHIFAGTATKLYKLSGTSWTDVTRTSGGDYTTAADGYWVFTNFGDLVIATNYNDDIQVFDVTVDTDFSQMSSTAPRARYVFVLNNFLVCLDTVDSDGSIGNRVRWSPIGNPKGTWTPSISTQAGFNDLFGGGFRNTAGTGTDSYGTILQDSGVWRMEYVGGDQIFTFSLQNRERGTIYPKSAATNGVLTYFLDVDGFCAFNGNDVLNIGENKINKWFSNRFNSSYAFNISSTIDPINKVYMFAYPTVVDGSPDCVEILLFNYKSGKWTYLQQPCEQVFGFLTQGFTLETLSAAYPDIETVPYSLDSSFWQGGDFLAAIIDSGSMLSTFSGQPYSATITTTETRVRSDGVGLVTSVFPIVEGGTVTCRIGYRNKLTDSVFWTPIRSQNSITNEIDILQNARFLRAELTFSNGWDNAKGFFYRFKPGGIV